MSNPSIEQLRERIDAKHAAAIQALDTLASYLDEVPESRVAHATTQGPARPLSPPPGSIRAKVLEIISGHWVTVPEIEHRTGLTTRQIRGVLTAPDVTNVIERRDPPGGQRQYRYATNGLPQSAAEGTVDLLTDPDL